MIKRIIKLWLAVFCMIWAFVELCSGNPFDASILSVITLAYVNTKMELENRV